MIKKNIADGVVPSFAPSFVKTTEGTAGLRMGRHKIPADLQKAFTSDKQALRVWEDITPLARNEWICWIISVKKDETRSHHIERLINELKKGKRRPCCWAGCTHR